MGQSSGAPSRLDAISTRWTLLREAHAGSAMSRQEARNALVLRYSPAVRRYVAALVKHDTDAEDIAQDVVVRLLAGKYRDAAAVQAAVRQELASLKRETGSGRPFGSGKTPTARRPTLQELNERQDAVNARYLK